MLRADKSGSSAVFLALRSWESHLCSSEPLASVSSAGTVRKAVRFTVKKTEGSCVRELCSMVGIHGMRVVFQAEGTHTAGVKTMRNWGWLEGNKERWGWQEQD